MDTSGLLTVPLPILTAAMCGVIAVLVWRLDLGPRRASVVFAALFALGAVQAGLVALRFGYSVTSFVPLQRVLPLFLAPLMYLGFLALTCEGTAFRRRLGAHLLVPLIGGVGLVLLPGGMRFLDWAISASYVYYAGALLVMWRRGRDVLLHAPVSLVGSLSNWMLRGIGLLAFLLVLDTAIALDFARNAGGNVSNLISLGTVPLVLGLIVILISLPRLLEGQAGASRATVDRLTGEHTDVMAQLDAIMTRERLFLDPGLTVDRLAKRLHLPARKVSAAVNQAKAINVSQYVNECRVAHAAGLLATGDASVKAVAEASGFLSRSNFYREFQRVHAMSPTDYRNSGR